MYTTDRTWAEIHLDRITHNYNLLRSLTPDDCRILAPVKADAYGHGAVPVARLLTDLGCDYVAVTCLSEALALRDNGISLPLLVFSYTNPSDAPLLADRDITQTVFSLETAQAMSHALAGTGRTLSVHIELDTGMGRLGFAARGQEPADALTAMRLPHLDIQGIFTHFPVADDDDDPYTLGQMAYFAQAADWLEGQWGQTFPLRHAANSGGTLRLPDTHLNMIRPGIALYGLSPNPAFLQADDLQPAMELKTRIIQTRPFGKGESISYGRTYETVADQTIAVIPAGYADGLHRALSGRMEMLLHGQRVPQVGRICMDACMLDVSAIEKLSVGDQVTIFGQDGGKTLSVDEHAALAGTISYELLCAVSPRVPRLYL